jgi:hypothetical protein
MLPENYKLNWFIVRHAFIGSITWFITYFYIRKVLNPYNWSRNMDEIFIESLFGSFAMFIMLLMNFILFKFYDCEDANKEKKLIQDVSKTFTQG